MGLYSFSVVINIGTPKLFGLIWGSGRFKEIKMLLAFFALLVNKNQIRLENGINRIIC